MDGTSVPTRDHNIAERSKNYRYSTNHQVVIDADTRLVVAVGRPLPGNRNDCKAWELSGAKATVGRTTVIADGGYRGTGLVIPHRREPGQAQLPAWKEEHNTTHRKVRARVEHTFARMKTWKLFGPLCGVLDRGKILTAVPVWATSKDLGAVESVWKLDARAGAGALGCCL